MTKPISLPRQVRDKHRKICQKGAVFLQDWPDVHRPLGAPKGDFRNTSFLGSAMLTREFSTGTRVVMNASGSGHDARDNFGCVFWSDGFVTGLGGAQPCPSQEQVSALFAAAGWAATV
jgi:hypothetical protein